MTNLFLRITGESTLLQRVQHVEFEGITRLSPAYDLVSSKLVLKNSEEELALPIRGRRNRLKKNDLIDYFAIERMNIPKKVVQSILKKFSETVPLWKKLIEKSFLPQEHKSAYRK